MKVSVCLFDCTTYDILCLFALLDDRSGVGADGTSYVYTCPLSPPPPNIVMMKTTIRSLDPVLLPLSLCQTPTSPLLTVQMTPRGV